MADQYYDMEDDDFYSEHMIEELMNEDEITPAEEGFMYGWLEIEEEKVAEESD